MIGPDRRQFLLGGVMLAAAGAAAIAKPRAVPPGIDAAALERAVPDRIGRYRFASASGVVLPPRDELSLATYDQYVARRYVAEGEAPVTLLIAYGQEQDYALQIHRPESCYPASGYTIGPARMVPLMLGEHAVQAVALSASRPGAHERILYWTRIGDAFPATVWGERAVILGDALRGRLPDGVLVRLSTPTVDADATAALVAFNAGLLRGAGPAARRVMLGAASVSAGRHMA